MEGTFMVVDGRAHGAGWWVVVAVVVAAVAQLTEIEHRLPHDLTRRDQLAETFLVREGVAGTQRAPAATRRWRPQKVLRFVRPVT